ncbi:MAG: hypothetical protein WCT26_04745 [Candidatus Buchananbacteria bacterium]|jgi:tetratricopeptide (TPR) repeat protein
MYFLIFIAIILIVSLALLLRIILRRLPELKVLDISAIPGEKQDKNKISILEAKFLRQKKTADKKISQIVTPAKDYVGSLISKLQDSVNVMEKKYKRQGEVEEVRTKSINELFAEAKAGISANDYMQAEKDLIEIISRDKKNAAAYELLFDIYRLTKNYSQAEEIIRYLIKLKSLKYRKNKNVEPLKKEKIEDTEVEVLETMDIDDDLAKYYNDLASIYELMDKKDKALDAYLKANAILPNNPKFLDKVIDLAINVGDKGLAKKTYKRLKEINPENAKLEQFREALEKMQ